MVIKITMNHLTTFRAGLQAAQADFGNIRLLFQLGSVPAHTFQQSVGMIYIRPWLYYGAFVFAQDI